MYSILPGINQNLKLELKIFVKSVKHNNLMINGIFIFFHDLIKSEISQNLLSIIASTARGSNHG